MTIYILNLLLILFWYFIFSYKNSEFKTLLFLIIVGLQLVLLGGLRDITIGTDTFVYAAEYETFQMYSFAQYSRLEYGYVFIMSLLSYLNAHFNWLLITMSAIIVFFIFKGIHNISTNIFLSVYLFVSMYLYYYSFNVIRQCIAVAICFFGYKYLLNRNLIKYALCVFMAAQFHTTAYIMLPVYFIYILAKQKKLFLIFLVISYFVIVFINPFINFALRILPRYIGYLDSFYMDSFVGMRYVLVYGAVVMFGLFIALKYKIDKKFLLEFLFICLAFVLNILTVYGFAMFARLAWYFTIYSIIFIPNCMSKISNKHMKVVLYILVFSTTFIYHFYFLSVNYHRITPYLLFWR